MAVLDVWETWSGRQSSYSGEFRQIDFKEERRWVKVFGVLLDGPTEDLDQTLQDCQTLGGGFLFSAQFGAPSNYRFPQTGDPHPQDNSYCAKEFNVRQTGDDTPNVLTVEVVYVIFYNPLLEPAQIEGDYLAWERVIESAYQPSPLANPILNPDNTVPITNSAYSPFDPPVTRLEPYRVLKVTVNLLMSAWDDPFVIENFVQCVNSDPFVVKFPDGTLQVYDEGTVLLETPPRFSTEFRSTVGGGVHYLRTTWEFKIREIGWFYRILDAGYSQNGIWVLGVNIAPGVNTPIYLGGAIAQNPQKLDGAGRAAPLQSPPVFLDYVVFAEANFNNLNLFQN